MALTTSLALLAPLAQPVNPDILAPHVEFFRISGTGLQVRLYVAVVALVGAACLVALLTAKVPQLPARARRIASLLPGLLAAIVLALPGRHPAFDYAALTALAAMLVLAGANLPVPRPQLAAAGRIIAVVAAAIVLAGFLAAFALTGAVAIPGDVYHHHVEMHYAVTVGDAYRANHDAAPAPSNYGEIMRLFGLAAITGFEALRSELPEPVILVRTGQFVSFVLLLSAVSLAGRRSLPGTAIKVLAASGLLIWNFLPDAPGTFFPNQSGLRFLPALALVVWCAVAYCGRPAGYKRVMARLFPLVCGVAIVLNPETVFVLACGGLAAAILSEYGPDRRVPSIIRAGLGYLLLFVLGFALSHGLSSGGDVQTMAELTFAFSSGYGGLADAPSASFVLACFLAFGGILGAIGRARLAGGNRRAAWDGLIATTILCWMPYYLNRMHDWNLWFQFALAMFLLARRDWRVLPRFLVSGRAAPGRNAAIIAGTLLAAQGVYAWQDYRDRRLAGCSEDLVILGSYCFPADYARRLTARLETMTGDDDGTLYITHQLPMTVIASGHNRALPYGETFGQVITRDRARHYAGFLRRYPGPIAVAHPAEPEVLYRTDLQLLEKSGRRAEDGANNGDAYWIVYLPPD